MRFRQACLAWMLALASVAGANSSFAQSTFPTPRPGVSVPGAVAMCPTLRGSYVPCGSPGALPFGVFVQGNVNAVPVQPRVVTAIATGSTSAVTATLTAIPGGTVYLCGFDVSAIGGTATIGPITVTGLFGGTFTYQYTSSATGVTLNRSYWPCIPAAGQGTNIAIVTTADGTASAVDVQAWGVVQ